MKKIMILLCLCFITGMVGCESQNLNNQNTDSVTIEYDEEVFDLVDESQRANVAKLFAPGAQKVLLDKDLHVYRYWGGGSGESGFYFSKKMYTERAKAKREMSLPERNTAINVTQYKIPKGTTLIYGNAANMSGREGYGMEATGGAEQYYLPNPSVAEKELVGKLEYTHKNQTIDELEEVKAETVN